jgi:excisionase family DNA binding protein
MSNNTPKFEPYSLTVREAASHFGFAPQTLYDWISRGKLYRGIHYLKVGKKVVIIREQFIKWMRAEDGSYKI